MVSSIGEFGFAAIPVSVNVASLLEMEGKKRNKGAHSRRSQSRIFVLKPIASQPIVEILFMEQLGEIGQRVQMFLKLALRHQKQHHQFDYLTGGNEGNGA